MQRLHCQNRNSIRQTMVLGTTVERRHHNAGATRIIVHVQPWLAVVLIRAIHPVIVVMTDIVVMMMSVMRMAWLVVVVRVHNRA